jgi:hypothetical protein
VSAGPGRPVELSRREADELAELLSDACTQVIVFGRDLAVAAKLRQAAVFLRLRHRDGLTLKLTGERS